MSDPTLSWGSYSPAQQTLFSPTAEHEMLRAMVAEFTTEHVEPQAEEHDEKECLNHDLFRAVGDLGLLGVTIPAEDGGAGMDTLAAVIVGCIEETIIEIMGNGSAKNVRGRAHPTDASAGDRLRHICPVKFSHLDFPGGRPDQSCGEPGNVTFA